MRFATAIGLSLTLCLFFNNNLSLKTANAMPLTPITVGPITVGPIHDGGVQVGGPPPASRAEDLSVARAVNKQAWGNTGFMDQNKIIVDNKPQKNKTYERCEITNRECPHEDEKGNLASTPGAHVMALKTIIKEDHAILENANNQGDNEGGHHAVQPHGYQTKTASQHKQRLGETFVGGKKVHSGLATTGFDVKTSPTKKATSPLEERSDLTKNPGIHFKCDTFTRGCAAEAEVSTRNDMAKTLNNAAGGPSPDAWHHCTAEDGPDCYGPPHNATVADRAGAVEAASAARNNKGGPSPDAWHHCTAEDGSDCFGPPKHNVTVDVSDNASGVRGEGQHLDVNEQGHHHHGMATSGHPDKTLDARYEAFVPRWREHCDEHTRNCERNSAGARSSAELSSEKHEAREEEILGPVQA